MEENMDENLVNSNDFLSEEERDNKDDDFKPNDEVSNEPPAQNEHSTNQLKSSEEKRIDSAIIKTEDNIKKDMQGDQNRNFGEVQNEQRTPQENENISIPINLPPGNVPNPMMRVNVPPGMIRMGLPPNLPMGFNPGMRVPNMGGLNMPPGRMPFPIPPGFNFPGSIGGDNKDVKPNVDILNQNMSQSTGSKKGSDESDQDSDMSQSDDDGDTKKQKTETETGNDGNKFPTPIQFPSNIPNMPNMPNMGNPNQNMSNMPNMPNMPNMGNQNMQNMPNMPNIPNNMMNHPYLMHRIPMPGNMPMMPNMGNQNMGNMSNIPPNVNPNGMFIRSIPFGDNTPMQNFNPNFMAKTENFIEVEPFFLQFLAKYPPPDCLIEKLPSSKTPVIDAFIYCSVCNWGVSITPQPGDRVPSLFTITDFNKYWDLSQKICSKPSPTETPVARLKALRRWFADFPGIKKIKAVKEGKEPISIRVKPERITDVITILKKYCQIINSRCRTLVQSSLNHNVGQQSGQN
jgi:hypothetical protein